MRKKARYRTREALVALVGERGYEATALEAVLERAGVEADEFGREFASFESCCVEVWQELAREFVERTEAAYARGGNWREGVRRQAWELCHLIVEDHARTRFLVEISLAEELAAANRDAVMSRFADVIHRGRFERPEAAGIPRARAEAIVGAVWEGVGAHLKAGNLDALPEGVPQILYLTMAPYLGIEAAEEEVRRGPDDLARYRSGDL